MFCADVCRAFFDGRIVFMAEPVMSKVGCLPVVSGARGGGMEAEDIGEAPLGTSGDPASFESLGEAYEWKEPKEPFDSGNLGRCG